MPAPAVTYSTAPMAGLDDPARPGNGPEAAEPAHEGAGTGPHRRPEGATTADIPPAGTVRGPLREPA